MANQIDSGFTADQIITAWKCTNQVPESEIDPVNGDPKKMVECGFDAEVPLTELVEVGTPQCPDCDCDMELQDKIQVTT